MNQIKNITKKYKGKTFKKIKHIDELGNEYWKARELQIALDYSQWRRFVDVINKEKLACINSNYKTFDHFVDVDKTIAMPKY